MACISLSLYLSPHFFVDDDQEEQAAYDAKVASNSLNSPTLGRDTTSKRFGNKYIQNKLNGRSPDSAMRSKIYSDVLRRGQILESNSCSHCIFDDHEDDSNEDGFCTMWNTDGESYDEGDSRLNVENRQDDALAKTLNVGNVDIHQVVNQCHTV